MNKNKGFIGIGIILAIVLGIVVVGGGAYYLGKSGSQPVVINPENILPNNENKNLPVDNSQQVNVANTTTPTVATGCTSSSIPSITVLSPNGGEIYKAGDKITVKWKSCNITSPMLNFSLMEHDSSLPYTPNVMNLNDKAWLSLNSFDPYIGTPNDGIEQLTLPKNSDPSFNPGQNYFINVYGENKNSQGVRIFDYSDNLFTINSATTEMSTVSANGMTVTIPKNGFTYDTTVAHAAGTSAVALNVGYNNKMVVSIYKWNNQSLFNESIPNKVDYQSVDMNYNIDNISAQYYKFSEGGESIIVVPSKLTIIQIDPISFTGISQSTLDQIIASIKL